jgi:hypothetical protein
MEQLDAMGWIHEKKADYLRGRQGLARALDKKDGALTGEPRIFDVTNSFSRLA